MHLKPFHHVSSPPPPPPSLSSYSLGDRVLSLLTRQGSFLGIKRLKRGCHSVELCPIVMLPRAASVPHRLRQTVLMQFTVYITYVFVSLMSHQTILL